jgi:hypothetical protein
MFVSKVSVRLKSNTLKQFTALMESEVLPWLQRQEGFWGLIALAIADRSEVQALSFWDHEENAQAYDSSAYPEVLKILEKLLDGIPQVRTFGVVGLTLKEGPLAIHPDSDPCFVGPKTRKMIAAKSPLVCSLPGFWTTA